MGGIDICERSKLLKELRKDGGHFIVFKFTIGATTGSRRAPKEPPLIAYTGTANKHPRSDPRERHIPWHVLTISERKLISADILGFGSVDFAVFYQYQIMGYITARWWSLMPDHISKTVIDMRLYPSLHANRSVVNFTSCHLLSYRHHQLFWWTQATKGDCENIHSVRRITTIM